MVNARIPVSRFWKWVLGIAGFCFLLILVLPYVMHSDALRQYAERQMNRRLTDYTVRVGKASFHPIGLSLDLEDLVLIQNEIPDPPIAGIKRLHATVHWKALIKGRLVGDFLIDRPEPLFVIVLAIAGFWFGEQAARRELFSQFSGLVGSEGAEAQAQPAYSSSFKMRSTRFGASDGSRGAGCGISSRIGSSPSLSSWASDSFCWSPWFSARDFPHWTNS